MSAAVSKAERAAEKARERYQHYAACLLEVRAAGGDDWEASTLAAHAKGLLVRAESRLFAAKARAEAR